MPFRMTLSDLAKYSMTPSTARSLCDRWASCFTARCITAVYAVTRCPSVRPSITFVSCAKTNKDIFEIFSPSGSQAVLVFPYKTGWRYSDGNPPNGGVECKGVWKNDNFWPIFRCIWETVIVRWAHSARQFVSIEFSVIAPVAFPGETKIW